MSQKVTRWRIQILGLITIVFLVGLLLAIAEWTMRWLRPDLIPSNKLTSIIDSKIGWRFKPSQTYIGRNEDGQQIRVRTNTLGFEDVEHSQKALPGTFRIAFLGDSFVAAVGVNDDDSFDHITKKVLEANLRSEQFEVLNFGIPGFGTANEYLTWKHYASDFHPDIVILAFFLGNDVANHLSYYPSNDNIPRPQFKIINNALEPISIPHQTSQSTKFESRNWFYRHLLAPSLLYQQYKLLERDLRFRLKISHSQKKTDPNQTHSAWNQPGIPTDWQTYLSNPNPEFEEAWRITEALLFKFARDVLSEGSEFYVVLIPGQETMNPQLFQSSITRYPDIRNLDFNLEYPRNRIVNFLNSHQISYLDLTPPIQAQAKKGSLSDVYFKFDGHFNAQGHRLAGEAIGHYLEKHSKCLKNHCKAKD